MLSAIAATLAIVALGYVLKQLDFLPVATWQALSPLCYWVLFPSLLFNWSQAIGASLVPFVRSLVATL